MVHHGERSKVPIATFRLLAGSHLILAGSRHEMLQEQDQYRRQFWAVFDAFVPGTPLY
jgi:lysophospholipase